jgi:hypothetical protein
LTAVVKDSLNQTTTSAGVTVTVSNPPPVISITSPTGGTVSGSVAVQANATSTIGMASVQFKLDGANLGTAVNGSGPNFTTQWFTGTATNGTHTLLAIGTDTQGQTTTSPTVTVTVTNTPPSVTINSPTSGATLLGAVSLTANATSTSSTIASVQFQVDGVNIGSAITGVGPTFTGSWNTGNVTNGTHSITAIATDAIGITQTSAAVSVTVNNPAPTISITNPTGAFALVGTVTVKASAASAIGLASVQFQLDGSNLGSLVTGSGPNFSTQWITTTATNGSHVLTAIAKDTQNQTTTSNPVTVNVSNGPPPPPSAVFLTTDTKTQGNWKGVYGSDGYIIANDSNVVPAYATLTPAGATPYTWLASTPDVRALIKGNSTTDRIASTFYTSTSYSFDINFNDGQVHQFALYALDYEGNTRAESVSILNANTNAVLNSQTLSNFYGGTYALWSLQGHVIVKVTYTGGLNAVASGLFFDTPVPPPPPPTISLISPAAGPVSGSVTVSANATSSAAISSVQFQVDGQNLGAPVTGTGPIYSFTWDTTTIVNGPHLLAAIATDTLKQTTTSGSVSVTSSNVVAPPVISLTAPTPGTVNGTVTVTANATAVAGISSVQFLLDGVNLGTPQTGTGPAYSIQWNTIQASNGSHTITAIAKDALNQTTPSAGIAVTVNNVVPTATFIKLDTVTQGNWKGVYGLDGSIIPNDATNLPPYATITGPGAGAPAYTWVGSSTDVRALLKTASTTDRIASTWYNGTNFTFSVNTNDGLTHQLALYCLDFGNGNRSETITIMNANTNAVLSSEAMSNFGNGVYAVFNITGNVLVTVSYSGGLNAVLSGLFMSTITPPPPPPTVSVTLPAANASVLGTITLTASATAGNGASMASVQFQVDGTNVGTAVTGAGPTFIGQWNTTTGTNGSHTIKAIATDSLGQTTTSAGVTVTANNPLAPPVINITTPSPGPISGTIPVTATATAIAGMTSVQFLLDGNNLGAAITGTGPTYTYQWNTTTATGGAHVLSAVAKDAANQTTTSATVNITVANTAPSATFIKTDAVTQGNWVGVYGSDGYIIPNDATSPPSYAAISGPGAAGTAYSWVASTTDTRALYTSPASSNRIASTYFTTNNSTPFVFDVNLTDGQTHQLALYVWDLENSGRVETISILNANTSAVLSSEAMSSFQNGVYAVWNVAGHVQIKVTYQAGLNAVLSGIFLKTVVPPPPPPSVSITTPTSSSTVTGTVALSATASSSVGLASVQFKLDGNNLGAPVTGSGPTFISQWNSITAANGSHSLTAVATDTTGQTATSSAIPVTSSNTVTPPVISITAPAAGTVSGVVTVTANATATAGMASVQFLLDGANLGAAITGAGPTYSYQWNTATLTGSHSLTAIATDSINQNTTSAAVAVTVFNVGPSAKFVKLDTVTQGSWKNVYGADGYIIANDSNNAPSYATVTAPGAAGPAYTWSGSTTDVRALLKGASQTDHIASTWYTASNGTPFSFDVNITDSQTHQLALYVLDFENSGRAESISILNASTNAVLVTQPLTSFGGGVYAIFNVTGHIQVKVAYSSGLNAVLSGLFFATPVPPPPPPTISLTAPASNSTQSGAISVNATAAANAPATMASVQFQVDGTNLGSAVTGAGPTFTTQWSTGNFTNGPHTLTAIATDSVGQTTTSAPVTLTLNNPVAPPTISIMAPSAGTVTGTVTVTASATAVAGLSSVQFLVDGSNLGTAVTGAGPTFTYQWNTTGVTGAHTLTAMATDTANQTTTSAGVSVTVINSTPSATFIKLDTVTQGNWPGVYGADGYIIPNDANSPPAYAAITGPGAAGPAYTWVASTTDIRGLLTTPSGTGRIASTWYTANNATPYSFDINLTDGQTHQLALYLLDLDNLSRAETITILNANTNAVLLTKPMSSFGNGVYAVFNITGHVQVKFTWTGGANGVLSGLFLSTVVPPPPAPSISLTAPAASGTKSGTINFTASAVANSPATMASVQFQVDGNNLGAGVTGAGPTFTTQWNTATSANGSHTLTAIATDSLGQTTTSNAITVTTSNAAAPPVISITAPAPGVVSGAATVSANATAVAGMKSVQFLLDGANLGSLQTGSGASYSIQWNTTGVTGAHTLTAVATDNNNTTTTSAAVSVTVSNVGPSATFVKTDAVTQGNWPGVYGADGYIIPNYTNSPPAYVTVTGPGAAGPSYTWIASTTSVSAPLLGPSTTSRMASTFYTSTSFSINLNVTDGQTHQVALYLWDLENFGRTETLSILNANTNAVLATRTMSSFGSGVYAVFNITGNVTLQVINNAANLNAVLSGLFFSTPAPPPPAPTISLTAPAASSTQSGIISINATATANTPATMASVQFQVDGNNLGTAVAGAGPSFTTQWNTGNFTNGSHSLTAIATDSLGQTTTSSAIAVTTNNVAAPPVISITAPVPGVVSGTVTVTANATAVAGIASVQFKLDGANLGSLQTGSGPNYSVQWNTTGLSGGHTLTAVATDNNTLTTTAAGVSVTVSNVGASATFIKTDAVTQGNWSAVYGADGYIIPNDANIPPSYATVTGPGAAGPAYTWLASTTNVSGLLTSPGNTSRIASTFYSVNNSNPFTFDINLTDGQTHQLALYLWDLENSGRAETITILNAATSAVLLTKPMSSFANGVYAVFNLTGHVQVQFTWTGGINAVLSGLFFSTPVPPPPAPSISLTAPGASSTQSGTINFTASAVANSPATMASVQFQVDGNNLGAAVTGSGPTFTTQWNTATSTNGSHSLTAIATDSLGQTTTSNAITVTTSNAAAPPVISITAPAPGVVSGTATVTANATAVAGMKSVQFLLDGANLGSLQTGSGPSYSVQWNTTGLTGAHTLSAAATDNNNQTTTSSVVSVTVSNVGPSATFIKTDAVTQGNWPAAYGADGYIIPNDASSPPSYAVITGPGAAGPAYTWLASTTSASGLLTGPSTTSRIASTFYTGTSFSININLTDGQTHQLALYLWDLENAGRTETLSILNASTNAVLATKAMSSFGSGVYAVFNITGNVTLQVTFNGGGLNAVLSGLFFSTPAPPPPAPTISITAPTTSSTQSGTINFTASAVANSPATMASVQFQVDGNNLGAAVTGPGATFTTQWNTGNFANGTHSLTAIATDSLGQTTASSAISVTLNNPITPPVVSITAPTSGIVSGTVTVTANATAPAGMSSVQFKLDGSNLGAPVTGAGPTYTVQWATTTTGPHTLTAVATDTQNTSTTSAPVTVTVSTASSAAYLVKLDSSTQGNWPGVYGADGYIIPNNASSPPAYATVTVGASPFTWLFPTTDVRGLLTAPSSTSRIASTWYSYNASFNINLNLTDGQLHQVALYALDYDTNTRSETISILDATTNAVLVTQPMPVFNGGIYAVFNIRGNVVVQVTNNNGTPNIVLSGLFFRSFNGVQLPTVSVTAPAGGATVSGAVTLTANATSAQNISSVQFQIDGVNQGQPQTGAGPNYSIMWASPAVSSGVHSVTAIATDTLGLSSTSPAISVTVANGPPPANSAVFTGSDTTTSGNWVGVYGSDGYMMADGGPSPTPGPPGLPTVINNAPFYALVNLDGALQWTWHDGFPATGSFALPISPTSSILIGAAYYQYFTLGGANNLPLDVDVTFADNQTHQLALYFVDWHHNVRHQQINIVDPNTQTVLSTQSIINFDQGIYLKYNVQGHVQVQVTLIPDNSDQSSIADSVVMAAMFFDPAH